MAESCLSRDVDYCIIVLACCNIFIFSEISRTGFGLLTPFSATPWTSRRTTFRPPMPTPGWSQMAASPLATGCQKLITWLILDLKCAILGSLWLPWTRAWNFHSRTRAMLSLSLTLPVVSMPLTIEMFQVIHHKINWQTAGGKMTSLTSGKKPIPFKSPVPSPLLCHWCRHPPDVEIL